MYEYYFFHSPTSVVFAELTNTEIFYGVKEYINCVNIIRADLSYIVSFNILNFSLFSFVSSHNSLIVQSSISSLSYFVET